MLYTKQLTPKDARDALGSLPVVYFIKTISSDLLKFSSSFIAVILFEKKARALYI
jgi:hypothetical protein